MQRIATIGGGHGQGDSTKGCIEYRATHPDEIREEDLTVIVSPFDNGGHSGVLLEERIPRDPEGTYLSNGDIRLNLTSAGHNDKLCKIFEQRMEYGKYKGDSIGNIIITSDYEKTNDFEKTIQNMRELLDVRANVVPCTTRRALFGGLLKNGYTIMGEEELAQKAIVYNSPIKKVFVKPEQKNGKIRANKKAIEAIFDAHKVVLCQGSLYTSLIPNLLVPEIANAIKQTDAKVIYVVNIVTQRGETDGFTAKDHLDAVEEYVGKNTIDRIIINNSKIPERLKKKYFAEGQTPVADDLGRNKRVIRADLLKKGSPLLRHDRYKLIETIVSI